MHSAINLCFDSLMATDTYTDTLPAYSTVERDWCEECEDSAEIVDMFHDTDVQTIHGTGPEYFVIALSCGHDITTATGRWA